VVLFDRSGFKLFTLKFLSRPVQSSSFERHKTAHRTLLLLFANPPLFSLVNTFKGEKLSRHFFVLSPPTYFCSVELAQLELLEDLRGGEDAGVDDAGHGEGATHNGANCREEVVERRPVLVVPHRDRVHVISDKKKTVFIQAASNGTEV
jgi:hypothetical protein